VRELLEAARKLGWIEIVPIGESPRRPRRLRVAVHVTQTKPESAGRLRRVIFHAVIDVVLDSRRAEDIAERSTNGLGLTCGSRRAERIDSTLRQLHLPRRRCLRERLPKPAEENAYVAVGDARVVIGRKRWRQQIRRVRVVRYSPGATANAGG